MTNEVDRPAETGENLPALPATTLPARDFRAGTAALAEMSQQEFDVRLAAMQRGRERLKQIHHELMTPEADYGIIPGTGGKPTLLKPGAEKLLHFYRLACEFVPQIIHGDGESQPWITVITECRLHVGDLDGPVVNTGHGAANSWEKRYRRGGPEVVAAFDMLNTLIKMAAKRAMVDATLRVTATSGVYTQDMEDLAAAPDPPQNPPRVQTSQGKAHARHEPGTETRTAEAPKPIVCDQPDCGLILSPDELKGSQVYAEAFQGGRFCKEHGREMIEVWKVIHNPEGAEKLDPFADQ